MKYKITKDYNTLHILNENGGYLFSQTVNGVWEKAEFGYNGRLIYEEYSSGRIKDYDI